MSIYRDAVRKQDGATPVLDPQGALPQDRQDFRIPRQFIGLVDAVIANNYRAIGLTGPSGLEGTSTVARHFAFHLASNLGSLGGGSNSEVRKVLLVNFCFGKPDPLAKESGHHLAGFLDNPEMDINECLAYQILPGVDYLPAGPMLRAPLEFAALLLWRLRGEKAFETWSHVVFDCPPVLGHRETVALNRHLDAMFLVLKHAHTKREVAATAADLLTHSGVLGGAVLNMRKFRIPEWVYRWI